MPIVFTPSAVESGFALRAGADSSWGPSPRFSFGPGGDRYAVNGDGHFYAFDSAGAVTEVLALPNPDGSPRSLETMGNFHARDRLGRIYLSYGGFVWVIMGGGPSGPNLPHLAQFAAPRAHAARSAKAAAFGAVGRPQPRN